MKHDSREHEMRLVLITLVQSVRLRPLLPILMAVLCGCTFLHSTTDKSTDPKSGMVYERTSIRACSVFDSKAALSKFRNTPGGPTSNAWVGGTSIGSLDQTASSSNLVQILGAIAEGAVRGLK